MTSITHLIKHSDTNYSFRTHFDFDDGSPCVDIDECLDSSCNPLATCTNLDRLCLSYTVCNGVTTYEATPGTTVSDRECAPVTECEEDEYEKTDKAAGGAPVSVCLSDQCESGYLNSNGSFASVCATPVISCDPGFTLAVPCLWLGIFVGVCFGDNSELKDSNDLGANLKAGTRNRMMSNNLIGRDVVFGDFNQIGDNVVISDDVSVGSNITIESNTVIDDDTTLDNNIRIGDDCLLEGNVRIGRGVNLGDEIVVEEGVEIGEDDSYHDEGPQRRTAVLHRPDRRASAASRRFMSITRVGSASRINAGARIAIGAQLGRNVTCRARALIGPNCTLAENTRHRNVLRRGVVVLDNVIIGDDADFAEGSIASLLAYTNEERWELENAGSNNTDMIVAVIGSLMAVKALAIGLTFGVRTHLEVKRAKEWANRPLPSALLNVDVYGEQGQTEENVAVRVYDGSP
ncbi:hypothetical protein SARC_06267 [Sphaeroforma arctica JP610]|uniref:Uncharacterized protein n=1 Tax=Sphaeroforma arctica JP610 TaxID=667725 RepID=A0A0L0FZK9_9EUKA|nr:hypothetical protein SARC_06267 [Sphaeroforma arctica JP610]KNC81403.1 hypothetical protein SARC_06267 [Sphaeroforma arctica JP610]|eukprot:XP_014155305.1 hypothetical protein SARC_06267 [Sphaeroforma arctica JP610]